MNQSSYQFFVKKIKTQSAEAWCKESNDEVITLFQSVAKRVPAYQAFLKDNKINPVSVKTIDDFNDLPYTDKSNYIDKYPLEDLVWDKNISNNFIINSSSGSTGKPYYWPLSFQTIQDGSLIRRFILEDVYKVGNKKTLMIITFGMGTWIAGTYTLLTNEVLAKSGLPLTTITPGFNKSETLRILNELGGKYDQVIIGGMPTFVKDVIDELSVDDSLSCKIKELRLELAGEGFTEQLRNYFVEKLKNICKVTAVINILGSAETAIMGFETKESIHIRKMAHKDKQLRETLFNKERLPSFEQYVPTDRYFQVLENELIITANRSIPLIRYNIHDLGGILTADEVKEKIRQHFPNKKQPSIFIKNSLPYVYVFGRGNFAATIYGALIYPENAQDVLIINSEFAGLSTGRFHLETIYTKQHQHQLIFHIELRKGALVNGEYSTKLQMSFVEVVTKHNSEYKKIVEEYGTHAYPRIIFHKYGSSELFPVNIVKKTS